MSEATFRFDAVPVRSAGASRALDWVEIVARLDAARELRASLTERAPGSFAPTASLRLSLQEQGVQGVNPTDLSNGKDAAGITGSHPHSRHSAS